MQSDVESAMPRPISTQTPASGATREHRAPPGLNKAAISLRRSVGVWRPLDRRLPPPSYLIALLPPKCPRWELLNDVCSQPYSDTDVRAGDERRVIADLTRSRAVSIDA